MTKNEHGIPLHACAGNRHDEYYWSYVRHHYGDWANSVLNKLKDLKHEEEDKTVSREHSIHRS
jgi:hypothetical protein